jgi:short-subunit dehydrogenase
MESKDQKVLITGGSGGIGLEVAQLMASKKYNVTLVARSENKLNEAKTILQGKNHKVIVADLNNANDLIKVSDHIKSERYDVLINNAGVGMYGQFIALPLEKQLKSMQLNMDALVTLSYAFLQNAKSGDSLVNVASLLGHSSFPGASVYAGTKSFVANFSESLWFEFKNKGIYVMSFNPGATKSDFHTNAGKETNSYPEFVLSTTQDVANDLVNGLENRSKPRVVSGWKNRLMLFNFKFLSRAMAIKIMGQISPGMK